MSMFRKKSLTNCARCQCWIDREKQLKEGRRRYLDIWSNPSIALELDPLFIVCRALRSDLTWCSEVCFKIWKREGASRILNGVLVP